MIQVVHYALSLWIILEILLATSLSFIHDIQSTISFTSSSIGCNAEILISDGLSKAPLPGIIRTSNDDMDNNMIESKEQSHIYAGHHSLFNSKLQVDKSTYHLNINSSGVLTIHGISALYSEILAAVSITTKNYRWKTGKVLINNKIKQRINQHLDIVLPHFCDEKVIDIQITLSKYLNNVSHIESWNATNAPFEQRDIPAIKVSTSSLLFVKMIKYDESITIDDASWGWSSTYPEWVWIRDINKTKTKCFEKQYNERLNIINQNNIISSIQATGNKNIVVIGDSQARSTYETMVRLICFENNSTITSYNGLLEYSGGISPFRNIKYNPYPGCSQPTHSPVTCYPKTPPVNLTCGGTFERYDNGCYDGGLKYSLPEKGLDILYAVDLISNMSLPFTPELLKNFTNSCPVLKAVGEANVIIAFLSMHDSVMFDVRHSKKTVPIRLKEYLELFGKKQQESTEFRYGTKLIFVSIWATDLTKRSKDIRIFGSVYRAKAFRDMQKQLIAQFRSEVHQNTAFIDIYESSIGAMDETDDGIHLYDTFPRSEIARRILEEIALPS